MGKRLVSSSFVICIFMLAVSAAQANTETVLYRFQGSADGNAPVGTLLQQGDYLYGATIQGGATCPFGTCGTVYRLGPPVHQNRSWTEDVLYVFQGARFGDGNSPTGGLIADAAGNLYGVTGYGGTGGCILLGALVGCGAVYELSPPQHAGDPWKETVLYSFQGGNDGYLPQGELVFDQAGNLYGTTNFGGAAVCNSFYAGCGTVFQLVPPQQAGGQWTESQLHQFLPFPDGAQPSSGLVIDRNGALYGTTDYGGIQNSGCTDVAGSGCGTIFSLRQGSGGGWRETVLYRFAGVPDGLIPHSAHPILDEAGNLYGTTLEGGTNGFGTVYELSRAGKTWTETILYNFSYSPDGYCPAGPLIFDAAGNLYGTTSYGGPDTPDRGTVFMLQPSGSIWQETSLYGFRYNVHDGGFPASGVLRSRKNGTLFGTTPAGGRSRCFDGCGTVFAVKPPQ